MRLARRSKVLALLACLAAAGGCALSPPPQPDELQKEALPNLTVPPAWASPGALDGAVKDNWVASFGDPALESLVQEALSYNADLRLASARVAQAAANVELAGATLYPHVGALARKSASTGGDGYGMNIFGLFASWEIDVWGRARAQRAGARSQYAASEYDLAYARQSIAALVVKSWVIAVAAGEQKSQTDAMIASAQRLVSMAGDRLRIGVGNDFDLAQAQAALGGYQDVAIQLDLARQQAVRALETLLGRYPSAELTVGTSLPSAPPPVPAGLPSQLLGRRPDVLAAQQRVVAAFYGVEQAKAARLPQITLTAGVNSVSSDLILLKNRNNPVWGGGGTLLAPIFMGGALEAQVRIADATQKSALANYGQVAGQAFAEVESALSSGFFAAQRADALAGVVNDRERTVKLAGERYRVGSGDLRVVSQEELALYTARTSETNVRAEQLIQRADLYLALGGDFGAP